MVLPFTAACPVSVLTDTKKIGEALPEGSSYGLLQRAPYLRKDVPQKINANVLSAPG